jgi:hypothetical protein
VERRPLRKSSIARGVELRLSVAITRRSLSKDMTLFRGHAQGLGQMRM